jgi:anti-sigma regulatory factor (Ser/Thr protein kinase)/biotin operon repressor
MKVDVSGEALRIVGETGAVTTGALARRLGISRQAAHRHLRALVSKGWLVREGAGRGARYRLRSSEGVATPTPLSVAAEAPAAAATILREQVRGLEEHRVWEALRRRLAPLAEGAEPVLHYAVTELVNNVIDHSGSRELEVRAQISGSRLAVEVIDEGAGLFEHVRRARGLASELEALQDLSKGKLTTWPERHTGEGLFFCSRAAERFEAESGSLVWLVDNARGDQAAGSPASTRRGTRVRFEIDVTSPRDLKALFDEYTEDFEFSKTRIVVKLFELGDHFVSRSEGKRLLHGLERFRTVVLDFTGVRAVGQGFADEVFRVWSRAHPEVRLVTANAIEPVAFMIERARRAASGS